jgi:hypothetical protein
MKKEPVTDALLREFLLGRLADEDRERIEALFLTDALTRERVLALEQDLIDDYLEDGLNKEDKERFVSRYARTDEQRHQLRINSAIRDWAIREANAPHSAAVPLSVWSRLWTWLRLNPRLVVPIAVAIMIAVVLAIVWRNSLVEQRKHWALEQELAQLNSPASVREVLPAMTSVDLRPVSVRSVESQAEIRIPTGIRFIELQLPWIQKERYPSYRAEVRRLGDSESFTILNLQADSNGGYVIRLRLPTRMLTTGHYQIKLTGVDTTGSASSSEEYSFVVVN